MDAVVTVVGVFSAVNVVEVIVVCSGIVEKCSVVGLSVCDGSCDVVLVLLMLSKQ